MSLSCQSLEVSRDDSGNSSSSSSNSSVILSLDELTQCQPAPSTSLSSSVDTGLWQPDCSLYYTGYELADSDVLLPLHKTVCCALCRFNSSQLYTTVYGSDRSVWFLSRLPEITTIRLAFEIRPNSRPKTKLGDLWDIRTVSVRNQR